MKEVFWVRYSKEDVLNFLPKLLVGVLACLIVLVWVKSFRATKQLAAMDKVESAPAVQPPPASKVPKENPAIKIKLFGDYVPNEVGAAGVKRSPLNVSVIGIMFAKDEKASHVVLELPTHETKVFRVGDTIPGGAVIKRITPEGILVLRDGAVESLSLPKNEVFFAPPSQPLEIKSP